MSLRYQKRIGRNNGLGLNLSNSGISSSYRTKYGTVSSRGFSIRTGLPGFAFRQRFSAKNNGAGALIVLGVIAFAFLAYYSVVAAYNIMLFLIWSVKETRKLCLRKYYLWKEKEELELTSPWKTASPSTSPNNRVG